MHTLPGRIKPGIVVPPSTGNGGKFNSTPRLPGANSPRIPSVPSPRPNFGGGSSNLRPKLPPNIKDLIKTPIPRPQPRIPDFGRPEASPPAGNNQSPLLPGGFIPRDPRLPGNFLPGANNGDNPNDNAGGQGNGGRPQRPDLSDLMQPRPRIPDNIIDIIRPEDLRPQLPGNFGEGNDRPEPEAPGNGNNGGNNNGGNNNQNGNGNDGQPDANVPEMELPPGAGNDAPDANAPDADVPPMELPPEADNPNEDAPHDDHNHHGQFPPAIIIDLICGNHGAGYCPPGIGFPGVGQPNVIVDPGFIASPPVDHGPLVSPIDESDLPRLPRVENGDEITLLLEQPIVLEDGVSLRAVLVIGDRPMVVEITSPETTIAVAGESAARTVSTIAVQLPTLLLIDEQPATILLGLSDTGEIVLEQPFVIVPLG